MAMIRKTYRVEGMHCTSCAMSVDFALEDLEGVQASKTSYATSTADVTFDDAVVDEAAVLAAIREAGYAPVPA